MARRRPRGILEMGWAAWSCTRSGRLEHLPIVEEHPPHLVARFDFQAGGGYPWRLSALCTPRLTTPPWRIVVITGAPSWAEYWSPVLAATPQDREMVVVDRPGFACSQARRGGARHRRPGGSAHAPAGAQARPAHPAGRPVLRRRHRRADGRRRAGAVDSLLLLSGFFGELGPTARALVELGARCWPVVPRDLRNAITEVRGQAPQLARMRAALETLSIPVHSVHGDRDDFAPLQVAQTLCRRDKGGWRFTVAPGANHFLNDGPVAPLMAQLEAAIPSAAPIPTLAAEQDIAPGGELQLAC